jgi:hypothetical protein
MEVDIDIPLVQGEYLGYPAPSSEQGGHHRLYFPKVSREEYPQYVVKQVARARCNAKKLRCDLSLGIY